MDFKKYLHAVSTGKRGNRDLTLGEAKDMMQQILQKIPHNEQIAAFLVGWRLKPETAEEFKGVLCACDEYVKKTKVKNSIELGYPFDGKAKNPYMFPLIAKKLEKSDLNLVVVGDERQPAKGGISTKEICTNIKLPDNIYYFDRKDFFKEFHELTDTRGKLGLRTGFNTIEKLPHVASSPHAITGVFHKPYVKKYVEIFAHRYKKLAIIQGNEGTPELFSKGRLWIAKNKIIEEFIIDPQHYGINYKKSWEKISLQDSLKQLQNPSDEFLKLATLNAAIYLFITDKAKSIDEAYEVLNG